MWVFDDYASYAGLREALAPEIDPPLTIGGLLINPERPPERIEGFPTAVAQETGDSAAGRGHPPFVGRPDPVRRPRDYRNLQRRFLLGPRPLTYVRTGIESRRCWLFRH